MFGGLSSPREIALYEMPLSWQEAKVPCKLEICLSQLSYSLFATYSCIHKFQTHVFKKLKTLCDFETASLKDTNGIKL